MVRTDKGYFVLLVGVLGAVGILDTAIGNPTMAAFADFLGADAFLASFIAGLYSLVAIPASIAMGISIDVIGRRRALVIGLGLTSIVMYGYSVAQTPLHLILFRSAHGVSGSLIFPASIAMVADAAKRGLGRNVGIYWLIVVVALALGSLSVRVLVETLGFRSLYLLVAGISLVGAAVALILPETSSGRMMPRASLGVIRSSIRWLSVAYVSYFSLYFALGAIIGSLSLVLIVLGASPESAAAAVGLYIFLAILVSLPLFHIFGRLIHRLGSFRLLTTGLLVTATSQLLLVLSPEPPYSFASSALLGVALASVFVASTTLAAMPHAKGSSMGFHQTANIAGVAVGAPLSGLLLGTFGIGAPFAAAILVQALTLAVVVSARETTRLAERQVLEA